MKKIILIFTLIAAMVFSSILTFADKTADKQNMGLKFTDIAGHWAEGSINKVIDIALYSDKDGKFYPDKAITKAEFILMLHKSLDLNINYFKAPDITEYFDDVKNEDIYASALYDLITVNIVDDKEQFYPTKNLTREEMVNYIMNTYKYKMGENYRMIKIVLKPFADDKEINVMYNGVVARAENMGIIKRPASNKFFPKHDATRAQVATVIDRLFVQLEKEVSMVKVMPSVESKDGVLKMKLTIINNTNKQITINHTSGQKFDFQLLDANKAVLYTWSADKLFIMALTETIIEPGKSVEFSADVEKEMLADFSTKPAYVNAKIVGSSKDFVIHSNGYEVEIK